MSATVKRELNNVEEAGNVPNSKKSKVVAKDDVFELGSKRKVQVNEFKGKLLVNIREFYEDKATKEEKPGNKGIALSVEQWNALKEHMEDIDAAIAAHA